MMKNLNLIKNAKKGKSYTQTEFINMNLFALNEVQQMSMSIHKSQLWSQGSVVTRGNAYRVYVAVFLLLLGPFTFFNLSKTKYLQV